MLRNADCGEARWCVSDCGEVQLGGECCSLRTEVSSDGVLRTLVSSEYVLLCASGWVRFDCVLRVA